MTFDPDLRGDEPGPLVLAHVADDPVALLAALERRADRERVQVGYDTPTRGDGTTVEVSTVDLVWAHPGGCYETLVFVPGDGPRFCRRYPTRVEAAAGHVEVVVAVGAGLLEEHLG